jgi:hypothetical protein
MAPEPKDERFEMRMGTDVRQMLRELAEKAGESEASVIRQLVRAAHAQQESGKAAKKR